jgi:hypothetical protein
LRWIPGCCAVSPCSARQKDRPERRYRATRHDRPPILLKESVGRRMCGLQRSVQPSRQVTSSPSAQAVEVASSAALIARRWHRGGRTGAASNTVCSTIALENPAELARRDTIGTLATLTIDIIILLSLRHCHGGAPRGERPASWDAPRPAGRGSVAPRTRDNNTSAPVGAPPTPLQGWTRTQGTTRAPTRAAGTKTLRCLTS